ncbi:hypothetical protein H4R19_002918 [Coemansia spiralis]|nr:hypothetical protein H4R19_002918 [Coemansia spiralis]
MSDYNVWNQLFRLNPDQPQTPMLSTQELQEELALWSNAQFQPEPASDEPTAKTARSSIDSTAVRRDSSAWAFLNMVHTQQQQPRQLPSQSPAHVANTQADPLDFIIDQASASDLLSAITSPTSPHHPPHWAQQQPIASGALGGVPMLPLAPLPSTAAAPKAISIAPAPTQYHCTPIVPKGDAAPSEQVGAQQSAPPRRALPKAKSAANMAQSPEPADDFAEADDQGSEGGRHRAAEEDKRRRNTAASARFRVKKKLKEQALERAAREMTAKAEALERRVHELETETRWLKSLITEKDPAALSSVSCPCHHPDGLDAAPAAKKQRL